MARRPVFLKAIIMLCIYWDGFQIFLSIFKKFLDRDLFTDPSRLDLAILIFIILYVTQIIIAPQLLNLPRVHLGFQKKIEQ